MMRRPPSSPLFPYTTLFRSRRALRRRPVVDTRFLVHTVYTEIVLMGFQEILDSPVEFHPLATDRKSTRLNSSHPSISYAVFCLKKKKHTIGCSVRSKTSIPL